MDISLKINRIFSNLQTESDIKSQNSNTQSNVKTVSHWKPKVYVSILTDDISMSHAEIPPEFGRLLR